MISENRLEGWEFGRVRCACSCGFLFTNRQDLVRPVFSAGRYLKGASSSYNWCLLSSGKNALMNMGTLLCISLPASCMRSA
jgi:hypothetical protein